MKRENGFTLIELMIIVAIVSIVAALLLKGFPGAFVKNEKAIRALEANGFFKIEIIDHSWFLVGYRGCDKSDVARFTAKATNPAGKEVQLYVCTGWIFKGATIRTPL